MSFARLRLAAAGALTLALTLGASPALAQGIDPSSLGEEGAGSLIDGLGSLPVGSVAGSVGSVGSADFPLGEGSSSPVGEPRPVDPSITESEFLRVERTAGDYEYWLVTSAAMQREVIVEVVASRGEDTAPVLYLLDGVGSPESSTGWRGAGEIADRMADEDVHVVNPAGAYAAYWTDWEAEDPTLGYNQWETFLTEELPGIVDSQLDTTEKSAIGGISMGGQAAMHLAATYPELYDGVMSFSGNYSTMDQLGYQTIRLSVETRGGDVDNMWGPHGSERWRENDTISHPEGLRGKAVYFSSGNGEVGPEDREVYGDDLQDLAVGLVLERGVLEGTKAFERALDSEGIEHRVDYAPTGLHNWSTFMRYFDEGWEHIKPALQG